MKRCLDRGRSLDQRGRQQCLPVGCSECRRDQFTIYEQDRQQEGAWEEDVETAPGNSASTAIHIDVFRWMLISYSVLKSVSSACFPPCQEEAKRKPPQRRMTRKVEITRNNASSIVQMSGHEKTVRVVTCKGAIWRHKGRLLSDRARYVH